MDITDHIDSYARFALDRMGFVPVANPGGYGELWHFYQADSEEARGTIRICAPSQAWGITLRDFMPMRDVLLEFDRPGHLALTWNESISGEEFTPYRKLRAKGTWGTYGARDAWHGLIHRGVPVRSASLMASPDTLRDFLDRTYPGEFETPGAAFSSASSEAEFPEMRRLLRSLLTSPDLEALTPADGRNIVDEALRLVVERTRAMPAPEVRAITAHDRERIFGISSYIDDHYTHILKVPDLARVAGMSPTKFKECFKAVNNCTLTQYIQRRRISQAEQMLHQPNLSIEQISRAVGYTCVSRFSELFRRETGLLPSEYRRGL